MSNEQPQLCARCGLRHGTQRWSGDMGSVMAMRVYNSLPIWCELCIAETQLEYAKAQAERIPELAAEVARLKESG